MNKKWRVLALAFVMAGCAAQPSAVNVGVTLYPMNPAANKYGVLRTVFVDRGNFTATLKLDAGRDTFEGQAMTVDNSYSGWGSVFAYGNATAYGGGMSASAFGTASASSHSTVRANSLRGVADGYATSGKRIQCEYVLNNSELSATGICRISDGALFRLYSKPL